MIKTMRIFICRELSEKRELPAERQQQISPLMTPKSRFSSLFGQPSGWKFSLLDFFFSLNEKSDYVKDLQISLRVFCHYAAILQALPLQRWCVVVF